MLKISGGHDRPGPFRFAILRHSAPACRSGDADTVRHRADRGAQPVELSQSSQDTGRRRRGRARRAHQLRSEEHTSELQSLMRISYAAFCLKKKKHLQSQTYIKTAKLQ